MIVVNPVLIPTTMRWQRVAVAALLTLPLVLVVALSAPGWVILAVLVEVETGRDHGLPRPDHRMD
jgi:hypothetical protein